MGYLTVYDQSMKMLGVLENASEIGYELNHNDLWTASFTLPAADPDNAVCQAHNLVRLPEEEGDVGLYRIIGMPDSDETALGGVRTYQLEHVMATLLDDVLFGYHEIGGVGIYTADVIRYILARQETVRWQLGVCEFSDQFQYHFENVSLLSALLSLGEVLADEYTFEFDTSTTPWTVNLRHADADDGCGITYKRNLTEIHKTMDASGLVTRLYPLGYGEGVNQLTIRDVNNDVPYIEADTVSVWGVKSSVWTDTRIEDPALLLARARQVLEGYKNPYITYTAKALDLWRFTGYAWDRFRPGKKVRVLDDEHGIRFSARIVTVRKGDVRGDPGDVEIVIANAPRDAADSINTLADRVGIGELYSQGATNLFAIPFNDNADQQHPAKMKVYLPDGLVRINKLLLTWTAAAFRSYETAASAGGGSEQTSSSGGGGSETSSSTETVTYTTEEGGTCTATTPQVAINAGVTGGPYDPDTRQDITLTAGPCNENGAAYTEANFLTGSEGNHSHTVNSHTHSIDSHTHTMAHTHKVKWDHKHMTHNSFTPGGDTAGVANWSSINPSSGDSSSANTGSSSGSTGSRSPGTDSQGSHAHTVPLHYHTMDHHHLVSLVIPPQTITIPNHGHNVKIPSHSHTVSIPAHSHSVTIPSHTHDMVYGIYEGSSAQTITIVVDGTTVPADAISGHNEIDVSPWLSKDQDTGKITRGTWHEIQLVPDALTRIEAHLFAQVFIQSVGGGNY